MKKYTLMLTKIMQNMKYNIGRKQIISSKLLYNIDKKTENIDKKVKFYFKNTL